MSSSSIESSCSYRTGQQQMESIKGIMWRAGNVLNSEEKNLFRVTATNCQPDLSLSNRITTDSSPPPPDLCSCFFMHLSAASSDTFRLHFSFLFTAFIALSPQHPLYFSPPLYPILSIPPSFSPPLSDTQTCQHAFCHLLRPDIKSEGNKGTGAMTHVNHHCLCTSTNSSYILTTFLRCTVLSDLFKICISSNSENTDSSLTYTT